MISHNWSPLKRLIWLRGSGITGGSATWETISGNPVSFTAKAAPLKQLSVAFSPVQDLHGYDSPWAAGGGANGLSCPSAFTVTDNGITLTSDGNGKYTLSGTSTTTFEYKFEIPEITFADAVYIHLMNSAANSSVQLQFYNGETLEDYVGLSSENRKYVATSILANKTINALGIKVVGSGVAISGTLTLSPMSLSNNNTTPWTPYSNICPILGWDSLNVEQRGKNLWSLGDKTFTGYKQYDLPVAIPAGVYTFSAVIASTDTDATTCLASFRDENAVSVTAWQFDRSVGDSRVSATVTFSRPVAKVYLYASDGFSTSSGDTASFTNIQLELGSTASDYQPYNPSSRSISITLGQTVYSGTVDVVTGVVTVTMASVDLGTLTWTRRRVTDTNYVFVSKIEDAPLNNYYGLCSAYPYRTYWYDKSWLNTGYFGSAVNVIVKDDSYTDAATFKTAMSGVQLVYELATPIPIQLTPQEVESLAGDNVLFSDANGDLTVEYRSN